MNLEDQVCSFELSKKLKELGIKQKSIFCYQVVSDEIPVIWPRRFDIDLFRNSSKDDRTAAFTVAELGEMLPWFIEINNKTYWYGTGKTRKNDKYYSEHEVHYSDNETTPCLERDNNEANARAKMLIFLSEEGIIKND